MKRNNNRFLMNVLSTSKDGIAVKISAPIILDNTKCVINWFHSVFVRDSQPWQSITKADNGITVSNADGKSKGITMKVSFRWFKIT